MRKFLSNEKGTETVEWAIMAGLIVVGLVAAVGLIGDWTGTQITTLQTELGAAAAG